MKTPKNLLVTLLLTITFGPWGLMYVSVVSAIVLLMAPIYLVLLAYMNGSGTLYLYAVGVYVISYFISIIYGIIKTNSINRRFWNQYGLNK